MNFNFICVLTSFWEVFIFSTNFVNKILLLNFTSLHFTSLHFFVFGLERSKKFIDESVGKIISILWLQISMSKSWIWKFIAKKCRLFYLNIFWHLKTSHCKFFYPKITFLPWFIIPNIVGMSQNEIILTSCDIFLPLSQDQFSLPFSFQFSWETNFFFFKCCKTSMLVTCIA